MSRIFGGCTSVAIVSATSGLCRREGSFGAFFVVQSCQEVDARHNQLPDNDPATECIRPDIHGRSPSVNRLP
jgi:hypothetical protein